MEAVSPITFLIALATPLSSSPIKWRWPTLLSLAHHHVDWSTLSVTTRLHPLVALTSAFKALSPARRVLAILFVAHYVNRSLVSSVRNPGRARMHVVVPLSAAVFNVLNGGLQGYAVAGGLTTRTSGSGSSGWSWSWASQGWASAWGVQPGLFHGSLFWGGLALFIAGLAGNIISDETLYNLKRDKLRRQAAAAKGRTLANSTRTPGKDSSPAERYSIPHGLLYDHPFGGVSQPSYLTEWLEWTGYCLLHASLVPGPFPLLPAAAAAAASSSSSLRALLHPRREKVARLVRRVPEALQPLRGWWAQPPVLFLANEVAVMLPRAVRTHAWYRETFGGEFPEGRRAVVPGLY